MIAPALLDAARWRKSRNSYHMVLRVLRQSELIAQWTAIARTWEPVREITTSFARYLPAWLPGIDGGEPLLARSLRCAIDGWESSSCTSDRERYLSYLRGLLYSLPEALEWRVNTSGEEDHIVQWNPLELGLTDWWKQHGGIPSAVRRSRPTETEFVNLSPADYRLVVLVRFLLLGDSLTPLAGRLEDVVSRFG